MAAWLCGALLVGVTCVALTAVSFTAPWWLVTPDTPRSSYDLRLGLWRACLDTACVSVFTENNRIASALGDWFYAVQAFTSIGHALTGLVLLAIIRYICYLHNYMLRQSAIIAFLAGSAYCIGVVIFAVKSHQLHLQDTSLSGLTLGSSFYCGLGAGVSGITTAGLLLAHYHHKQTDKWRYELLN